MKLTIKQQLITSLLLVGIIPLIIIGILSYNKAQEALQKQSYSALTSARDIKTKQILTFFKKKKEDIQLLTLDRNIKDFSLYLTSLYKRLHIKKTDKYPINNKVVKDVYKYYDKYFTDYVKINEYYDIFLIHPKYGQVMYTQAKEADFGENLKYGALKDSGLGELYRKVLKYNKTVLVDMKPYAPSNGAPAMFIGTPLYVDGELNVILALQISDKAINNIMKFRKGYGKTQEDYLVGIDKLMRSDSFLDPKNHTLKASFANPLKGKVDTEASRAALEGKTDTKIIIDYNGNPVLSAYTSIKIDDDITWAIMSEIDKAEVDIPTNKLKNQMILIGIIAIVIILILAILFANYIAKPITKAVEQISSSASQIISASNEVSSSAVMLAQSSSNQASSVEEISATIEETSATIEQTANNSSQADILSEEATKSAQEGYEYIKKLLISMDEITDSSKEIANIIKTIDEIAFQTNLLALNAAVEAARAGEHGLGFAVVADEVRNLAGKSANAAKETATIIENSLSQIDNGNKIAQDTNKAFEEILEKVKKSGDLVSEITLASKEQADGIKQINKAMSQIDKVTQTIASTSEQSAAASEELNAQAISMGEVIKSVGEMVGYKVPETITKK